MKKLFAPLLLAAIALSGCAGKIYKTEDAKANLEKKGYQVSVLTEVEAKVLIAGINFSDSKVTGVVSAVKGEGDDHDIFLGFYFATIKEADEFMSKNDNENYALMSTYGEAAVGKNLKAQVGSHNNVAYVGSATSYKVVF